MRPTGHVSGWGDLWLSFETRGELLARAGVPEGKEGGTDNERCQFYQRRYLEDRADSASFASLWELFTLLCLKAVRKERRDRGFFLDAGEARYRADIACEYTLRRYDRLWIERGEVYVVRNFIAEAYHGARHALYDGGENDLYLSACMELSGKPVEEISRRGLVSTLALERGIERQRREDKDLQEERMREDVRGGQMLLPLAQLP